ncbi:hypothetical protein ACFQT0_19985 [Hymenobacter humi]|uniref:Uncharacterized protein n=1 Tax=Hymenobacter humi TaxID=1411620 RepID=A0ABW2UAY3_9BACT
MLDSRRVTLPAGRRRARAVFQITAPAPGKRRYEVRVVPQPGEFTELNNARTAFIEIVKGKLRVLLAGAAPHPDLKALRAAILANDNFDLTLALPGVAPLRAGADFDVAILHQLPAQGGLGNEILAQVKAKRTPAFYIIGAQSDLPAYNQAWARASPSRPEVPKPTKLRRCPTPALRVSRPTKKPPGATPRTRPPQFRLATCAWAPGPRPRCGSAWAAWPPKSRCWFLVARPNAARPPSSLMAAGSGA